MDWRGGETVFKGKWHRVYSINLFGWNLHWNINKDNSLCMAFKEHSFPCTKLHSFSRPGKQVCKSQDYFQQFSRLCANPAYPGLDYKLKSLYNVNAFKWLLKFHCCSDDLNLQTKSYYQFIVSIAKCKNLGIEIFIKVQSYYCISPQPPKQKHGLYFWRK